MWFCSGLLSAIHALTKEVRTMAANTAALTQAVTDLTAAASTATLALDDLAKKLANIDTSDPTAQAAIDAAVTAINGIRDGLNATVAKDDPAPTPAPAP